MLLLLRPFAAFAARPRDVDGIGERRDRRKAGGEFRPASDVIGEFVVLDNVDLHGNAGEGPNFVLADPHGHFAIGRREEGEEEGEEEEEEEEGDGSGGRGRHSCS